MLWSLQYHTWRMKYMFENKIKKKKSVVKEHRLYFSSTWLWQNIYMYDTCTGDNSQHPQSCSACPHFTNGSCPFHRVIPCYYTECLTIDHGEVVFRRLFLLHLKPTPSSFLLAERHIKSRSLFVPYIHEIWSHQQPLNRYMIYIR